MHSIRTLQIYVALKAKTNIHENENWFQFVWWKLKSFLLHIFIDVKIICANILLFFFSLSRWTSVSLAKPMDVTRMSWLGGNEGKWFSIHTSASSLAQRLSMENENADRHVKRLSLKRHNACDWFSFLNVSINVWT